MRLQIDVTVLRGAIAEARHRMQAVACDAAGECVATTDDAGAVTSFRSAARPFQLLPLVERGHAERWRLSDWRRSVVKNHAGLEVGRLEPSVRVLAPTVS